jgi:hypothetical protein
MGVKIKELKKEEPKLGLGVATQLSRSIMALKVPTYQDVKRIEVILKELEVVNQIRQKAITDFYEKNNLPKDEDIDASHPLYYDFNDYYLQQTTEIPKSKVALYTLKEFNAAVDGLYINFGERKMMEIWLVKDKEEVKS